MTSAAAARHQAITSATGLFYVRELQTLIGGDLPPALTLTADTPTDLAPGCASDHPGPPAAIQPFLELLLEVPLAGWWFLQGAWTDLPDVAGVQRIGALRASRLASAMPTASFGSGAAAGDLSALAGTDPHGVRAAVQQCGRHRRVARRNPAGCVRDILPPRYRDACRSALSAPGPRRCARAWKAPPAACSKR